MCYYIGSYMCTFRTHVYVLHAYARLLYMYSGDVCVCVCSEIYSQYFKIIYYVAGLGTRTHTDTRTAATRNRFHNAAAYTNRCTNFAILQRRITHP